MDILVDIWIHQEIEQDLWLIWIFEITTIDLEELSSSLW
jgi:hypothetical protein